MAGRKKVKEGGRYEYIGVDNLDTKVSLKT